MRRVRLLPSIVTSPNRLQHPLIQRSEMTSTSNKLIPLAAHHQPLCTRTQLIGSLFLVFTFFFFTRLFDYSSPCNFSIDQACTSQDLERVAPQLWPERGYGSQLSLKIYIYDVEEIHGLKAFMYGRDGKITEDSCLKVGGGLRSKSTYRTRKKEEADLFFVPSYVKCVRMMGGLSDQEIDQACVKVLSQMPYFRLSGGHNHIFVFPM